MSITLQKIKALPDEPGVYFFLKKPHLPVDKQPQGRSLRLVIHSFRRGEVLYIGKAGSLRDRVRSYFSKDIAETRGPGITQMVAQAQDIAFQETDSVLEAVLLEAELIKKYQPKYNVREKDDKSFTYVAVTREDFPRILTVRGKQLADKKLLNLKSEILNLEFVFGPFPQTGTLREALAIIRKIFPYRDKCTPFAPVDKPLQGRSLRLVIHKKWRSCFNRQIGLCPGVCTGEISKNEYGRVIRNIALLFRGKKKSLLTKLSGEMKIAAREQKFERAAEIRNTIFALEHIQDVSLIKREQNFVKSNYIYGRSSVYKVLRIEAYDIAHTSGKEIVGVMVTVYNGEPDKSAYRKFNLRTVHTSNDPAALKEVLERRLSHAEWPFPDLLVVDGGKAQSNVAMRVLEEAGLPVPVIAVVKDERHRPREIRGDAEVRKKYENEILLANSEAHRFAISFHRDRMRKRQ
ncbi:MAG: hypothetical protein A3D67_01265 [Candidatus Lloydbacteria bacterium RIFCSPHIGHO2_02_FULL_51_22]|uniref:Excinuclease ABC subunit C n=2 Tax=Candidatus Lloydiibacteriota TaxID=1817910 RepID=A0A1G2D6I8_9BACT|nr:MAG: hypothetical protein A3D67_01265 [Candidatus Lloydbacteria bacterium RIFCSPHIGHO2_02_FULL_51_22]OGZ15847.1 MAG: hypothetical protein A3J08_03500 [Candidatus Lloydbacteria bacterium RIFCSPLOWO2_02_FULL_51_11]